MAGGATIAVQKGKGPKKKDSGEKKEVLFVLSGGGYKSDRETSKKRTDLFLCKDAVSWEGKKERKLCRTGGGLVT